MEFRILGPLEVESSSGERVALPAGRERTLLVALLLRRGEVVSVDALVDALWGERAPATAAKAIQGYVSHLRRLLGDDGGSIVTRAPGYLLQVETRDVDATRFERLAADGRRALEDEDPARALEMLDAALELWRGPALPEFAFDDFAQAEIQRLTELRLEASEDRVDALLELGRHNGLVPELEALVAAHPLRERVRGQLMLALYRSGRPVDALQSYKGGAALARELGLDPAPELRRLERAILEQDPGLAAPMPQPAGGRSVVPGRTRMRAGRWLLLLAAALGVGLLGVLVLDRVRDSPASIALVPPAVAVIDPETNRIVSSVDVGSKPVTITAGVDALWIGDARDGTVTRVDTSTLATKAVGVGAPAIDVAASGDSVWVATGGFGEVVRIDVELDSVTDRIQLGEPGSLVVPAASSVAAGSEGVWVGAFDGLVRLDPSTGREVVRVDLGSAPAEQAAVGGGAVWATTIASRAKRVEARSADVTAEFYAGVPPYPVTIAGSSVWLGGAEWYGARVGQVWQIDAVTAAQRLSLVVGGLPAGIAVGAGAVWVAIPLRNQLLRIDAKTGTVRATIQLSGPPGEIVVSDGRVWVIVGEPDRETDDG